MAASTQEDLVNLKLQVFAVDFYSLYQNLFILVVANTLDDNQLLPLHIWNLYKFCEVLYKFDN